MSGQAFMNEVQQFLRSFSCQHCVHVRPWCAVKIIFISTALNAAGTDVILQAHLLQMVTRAPRSAAPKASARPAPPAPSTTTRRPCSGDLPPSAAPAA